MTQHAWYLIFQTLCKVSVYLQSIQIDIGLKLLGFIWQLSLRKDGISLAVFSISRNYMKFKKLVENVT